MVHVIQDETERRQHSRLFQRSLTNSLTSSFTSTTSNTSSISTKLELMCAQLLTETCDAPPEVVSIPDKYKDKMDDSPLASTLMDLLPNIPREVSTSDIDKPKSIFRPKRYPSRVMSSEKPRNHRRATVEMPPFSRTPKANAKQWNRRSTIDSPPPSPSNRVSESHTSSVSFANVERNVHVVTDMEWTIKIPPFLQGHYSGAVDKNMQPHGKGTWVHYTQNHTVNSKISGRWYEGSFIPHEYPHQDLEANVETVAYTPKRLSIKSKEEPINCAALVKTKLTQDSPKKRQYKVGEVLRSRNDIIDGNTIEDSEQMQMICNLKEHDEAWIRRSDGKFTFAKVAKRQYELQEDGVMEDTLVFEVNSKRSKKHIPKRLWPTFIFLPSYAQSGQVNRSACAA